VLDSKNEAVKDNLYEEASILRRREVDYRAELVGKPDVGSTVPVVEISDIEAIVSSWTGAPLGWAELTGPRLSFVVCVVVWHSCLQWLYGVVDCVVKACY
jgi:hypothetical protein